MAFFFAFFSGNHQQSDLQYLLLAKGGGGNSGGNSGKGNSGDAPGQNKDKSDNGKDNVKVKNKDTDKEEREKKKEAAKSNGKGYREKGKHLGWYKNGKIPQGQDGDKVELTYYLNDVSDPLTQVLMTYGEDGRFDAAYTYGLERIVVEALDDTRPEAQDPLYYLYDGLGSVTYMVKPDGNIRDHYRYDEFGKPAPGNTKLSSDGVNVNHNSFGYTGEMWDEESELLYLRARYYEAETSRMLSRDQHWNATNMIYGDDGNNRFPSIEAIRQSSNLYNYAMNNPNLYIDPHGNKTIVFYYNNPGNGFDVQAKNSAYFDSKSKNVVMIPVTYAKDFVNEWNKLNSADIDDIYLYLHGGKGALYFLGDSLYFKGALSFSNLQNKRVVYGKIKV